MELSDWQLVQKCQAGDIASFQELVSRYHQKVYMVIFGLLRNRDDAMEVAQESFFRAYRKITIEITNPDLQKQKLQLRHRPGYFAKAGR